nr:right-handed parallel beta-helix repeat-containing protein [uncultured Actinotalea sp.]
MADPTTTPRAAAGRRRSGRMLLRRGLPAVLVVAVLGAAALYAATRGGDRPVPDPPGAEVPTAPADEATASLPSREDFPDETTTGVPEGVQLEPSESLRVTEDGAVIDGLLITGTVVVEADDVVIRNTVIRNTGTFAIRVDGGRNLLVEDSEIDGQGRGAAAVAFGNYTLRRVHIHHVTEGPRIAGGTVLIEDSLVHRLVQAGDNHTDVVQAVGGREVVLRGNALLADDPEAGTLGNAAFQFGEEDGELGACLVEGNLLSGGNYTVNGGGGGTTGAGCVFRDNVLMETARYGARANLGGAAVWESSNVWLDTGEPVP